MHRRDFFFSLAAATTALAQTPSPAPVKRKGQLKQAVTRGVFGRNMPLEDACREAARPGCKGFDLIGPTDWPLSRRGGVSTIAALVSSNSRPPSVEAIRPPHDQAADSLFKIASLQLLSLDKGEFARKSVHDLKGILRLKKTVADTWTQRPESAVSE